MTVIKAELFEAKLEQPNPPVNPFVIVRCQFTPVHPTAARMEQFYVLIRQMCDVSNDFVVYLDATQTELLRYLIYFPKILREMNSPGKSKCCGLTLRFHDVLGIGER